MGIKGPCRFWRWYLCNCAQHIYSSDPRQTLCADQWPRSHKPLCHDFKPSASVTVEVNIRQKPDHSTLFYIMTWKPNNWVITTMQPGFMNLICPIVLEKLVMFMFLREKRVMAVFVTRNSESENKNKGLSNASVCESNLFKNKQTKKIFVNQVPL